MPTEIERKFIVQAESWHPDSRHPVHMRQGYFETSEASTVRVRLVEPPDATPDSQPYGVLTIKGRPQDDGGLVRPEFEYEVPAADAESMLELFCGTRIVEKTRHLVDAADHTWEVDVFEGRHSGLVLAEVELEAADEQVELPEWVGREVTRDASYTNAALARSD